MNRERTTEVYENLHLFKGGPMTMTPKKDSNLPAGKSEAGSKPEQDGSASSVSTRVGRNTVDIDVPALKHLVETVKDKFK